VKASTSREPGPALSARTRKCLLVMVACCASALAFATPGTWVPTGPAGMDADGGVAATREDPAIVYVSGTRSGLFRSTDRGAHWAAVAAPTGQCSHVYAALGGGLLIARDSAPPHVEGAPADPAACSKVWRSVDGGLSWSPLPATPPDTYHFAFAQHSPGAPTVHALAHQVGAARSQDGGASWTTTPFDWPSPQGLKGLHIVRDAPDTVFAFGGRSNVFRSIDAGVSWSPADAGLPGLDPLNLGVTAMAGSKDRLLLSIMRMGVYRSFDGGSSWTASNAGLSNPDIHQLVDVDGPENAVVAVAANPGYDGMYASATFFLSVDGGATWIERGRLDAPGLTRVAALAGVPQQLVASTRNGVFVSDDLGASWTPVPPAHGLPANAIAHVGATPSTLVARWFHAGTDNPLNTSYGYASSDAGERWALARGTDGYVLDLLPPSGWRDGVAYAFGDRQLLRGADGGSSWEAILEPPWQVPPPFGAPLYYYATRLHWVLDGPAGDPLLVVGGTTVSFSASSSQSTPYVARSEDGGATWTRAILGVFGDLRALARSPLDENRLYASVLGVPTGPGRFMRSADAGRTWSAAGTGLPPSTFASSIVVDPVRSNVVFVAVAADLHPYAGVPAGVYRSVDSGLTFAPRSTGLPPVGVNTLALDRNDPATLYAATDGAGVYRSTDGGAQWSPIGSGLPPGDASRILSLALDPVTGRRLLAGTRAGAFRLELVQDAGHVPVVEYFHAGFGHYFMSSVMLPDLRALDTGAIAGWARTGKTFRAYPADFAARNDVCRFFSGQTFAPKSSHFYTPYATECELLKAGHDWIFEGDVFRLGLPTGAEGSRVCAPGSSPLYRAYNDGRGGAANHRYTPDPAVLDAMIAQGWIMEGEAQSRVFACLPLQP